jgi:NADH dehydrogenase
MAQSDGIEQRAKTKRVIIVGGGFGGLNAALTLGRKSDLDIWLLDRRNHHLFQPLLYQVAMAGLSPGEIASPIRTLVRSYENVRVLLTTVTHIDLNAKVVESDLGPLAYDYLVLSCGAQHSYFHHEEWEPYAPGLKTIEQATEIRRRVLLAFELAERETNPERLKQLLSFVVVGGGPTGVELAGALGEISRFALARDFRHIDPSRTRVILIEAGPRILASFSPELSAHATRDLEDLGVTVWTNTRVTEINANGVKLGDEAVQASTVLWAAGVKPSELNTSLGVPLDRAGRVFVGPDLSIPGYPNAFVIGDQAHVKDESGQPLPGLAAVAMQEGRAVARSILADISGHARRSFHYKDKGQMATIGRKKAVAEIRGLKFTGLFAWLAWLLVHIYYLIGFKSRILVLVQWAWSYLTYRRGAQLIISKEWRSFPDTQRVDQSMHRNPSQQGH